MQQSLTGLEAAQREFTIVFDGGSLGNPGRGYGSYVIIANGAELVREQLNFDHLGSRVTNNQAEYLTLIAALIWLRDELDGRASSAAVTVRGDSMLVISQLLGRWKVKNPGLRPLYEEAKALVHAFGRVDLRWHERMHSVELLGH